MRMWCPSTLSDGSSFYRILQPAAYDTNGKVWPRINEAPPFASTPPATLIAHRTYDAAHLRALEAAKAHGWRVVIDMDDDLFHVPEWNSATWVYSKPGVMQGLRDCLSMADLITTSTEHLSAIVRGEFPEHQVEVFPNRLDLRRWQAPMRSLLGSGRVTIAWSGSDTHKIDLEMILPALEEVERQRPQVVFAFFAYMPPSFVGRLKNYVVERWAPLARYSRMLMDALPDIALLPLVDDLFNRSKSNIKWMEFTMAGAACVGSRVGPYAESIEQERTGMFADDVEGWVRQIVRLIDDTDLRNSLVSAAQVEVQSRYNAAHDWSTREPVLRQFEPSLAKKRKLVSQ